MTPPTRCIAEYHLGHQVMCLRYGHCQFEKDKDACELKRSYDIQLAMVRNLERLTNGDRPDETN